MSGRAPSRALFVTLERAPRERAGYFLFFVGNDWGTATIVARSLVACDSHATLRARRRGSPGAQSSKSSWRLRRATRTRRVSPRNLRQVGDDFTGRTIVGRRSKHAITMLIDRWRVYRGHCAARNTMHVEIDGAPRVRVVAFAPARRWRRNDFRNDRSGRYGTIEWPETTQRGILGGRATWMVQAGIKRRPVQKNDNAREIMRSAC